VIVVDSSVAFKWFVPEPGAELASELLETEQLIAPDLVFAEVMNAAWKAARRGLFGEAQQAAVASRLRECFAEIVPSSEIAAAALAIAIDLNHPVYDAFYIALAEQRGTVLVTADEVLQRKTKRTRFAKMVRTLAK
jgi:predicted nucleic acid-binding protein